MTSENDTHRSDQVDGEITAALATDDPAELLTPDPPETLGYRRDASRCWPRSSWPLAIEEILDSV